MRRNRVKKIAILAVFLCINSIPVITYAKDARISGEVVEKSGVEINDNWLTEEVAKQLSKKVDNLTEADFLNIKKIDLSHKRVGNNIPEEIKDVKESRVSKLKFLLYI